MGVCLSSAIFVLPSAGFPWHFFLFLWTEQEHGPLCFLIPAKAQGSSLSFPSNLVADSWSLKQPLGLWFPNTDLQT